MITIGQAELVYPLKSLRPVPNIFLFHWDKLLPIWDSNEGYRKKERMTNESSLHEDALSRVTKQSWSSWETSPECGLWNPTAYVCSSFLGQINDFTSYQFMDMSWPYPAGTLEKVISYSLIASIDWFAQSNTGLLCKPLSWDLDTLWALCSTFLPYSSRVLIFCMISCSWLIVLAFFQIYS